jgi:hypothetical protein
MELDIGIGESRAGADETAGLELVRRAKPGARQHPLRPHQRLAPERPVGREADRFLGGELDIHLQVILQVLAHAGRSAMTGIPFSTRCLAGPIPLNMRIFGELIAPAARTISARAVRRRPSDRRTPLAFPSVISIRSTSPRRTVQLPPAIAGRR